MSNKKMPLRIFVSIYLLFLPLSLISQANNNRQAQIIIKNWAYFHNKGKYNLAIEQTNQAFELGKSIGDLEIQAISLNREGRSLLLLEGANSRKQRRLAKEKFIASNNLLEEGKNILLRIDNLKRLIDISAAEGNIKEVDQYNTLLTEAEDSLSAEEENTLLENEIDSLQFQQQVLSVKIDELVDSQLKSQLLLAMERMRVDSLAFLNLTDSIEMAYQRSELELKENEITIQKTQRNFLLALSAFITLATIGLIYRFIRIRKHKRILEYKNQLIKEEQKKSEELLLNILPVAVAKELKLSGKAKARRYKQATVFFSDFKNFTGISKELTPEYLVSTLDLYFRVFDEVINQFSLEKIKTIGDAYMCVGGLPTENSTNAADVINAALTIQRRIGKLNEERTINGEIIFEARIGIHTGPLVSGVVGSTKFAFDVWGDTVNVASRMETSGEVGKVNISGDTYNLVKDYFKCSFRGKLPIKNRGEMEMYFVEGAA